VQSVALRKSCVRPVKIFLGHSTFCFVEYREKHHRAMREFQKYEQEFVCWLGSHKTSSHNLHKARKRCLYDEARCERIKVECTAKTSLAGRAN
jgi:hypothetical protein